MRNEQRQGGGIILDAPALLLLKGGSEMEKPGPMAKPQVRVDAV